MPHNPPLYVTELGRQWQDPDVCFDACCIIDGQGDPAPEEGGAIPVDPVDGWVPGYSDSLIA